MFTAWVIFHVIVCIGLVLVVLMQSAKGEGLAGSAFGGGGGGGMGGAVFGGRGAASFLSHATTILAVVFMLNCIALAYMSSSGKAVSSGLDADGSSAITRQAQQEYDQSQQAQQQRIADSLSAAGGGDTTVSLDNLIPSTTPETSDDDN